MEFKKGDLANINPAMAQDVVRDFRNESLYDKADLIEDIVNDGEVILVHSVNKKGIVAIYQGVELLLYNKEVVLAKQPIRRF